MKTVRLTLDTADVRDVAAILAVEVGRKVGLARMFSTFSSEDGGFGHTAASYAREATHLAGVAERLFLLGNAWGQRPDSDAERRRCRQLVQDYAQIGLRAR